MFGEGLVACNGIYSILIYLGLLENFCFECLGLGFRDAGFGREDISGFVLVRGGEGGWFDCDVFFKGDGKLLGVCK